MSKEDLGIIFALALVSYLGSFLLVMNVRETFKDYAKKLCWQREHQQLSEREEISRKSMAKFYYIAASVIIMLSGWLGLTLLVYLIFYQRVTDRIANMSPQNRTFGFGSNAD